MDRQEIMNIAQRLDDQAKLLIEKELEERLEILKEGDLSEEELSQMEECLFASLVLQEFLDGEYELLEEERQALFDEMEEMYNRYNDLLVRARIEEKVGKKKRMTLELMRIRERLMNSKQDYKDLKNMMKNNRERKNKLNNLTKKEKMKDYSKSAKKDNNLGGVLGGLSGAQARAQKDQQAKIDRLEQTVKGQNQQIRDLKEDHSHFDWKNKRANMRTTARSGGRPTTEGQPSHNGTLNPSIEELRDNLAEIGGPSLTKLEEIDPPSNFWKNSTEQPVTKEQFVETFKRYNGK
ncbi:MAG: hypothetical protein IKJ30_03725 [Bacilli bacterium]|nr:hypothetical protein [Bacilli bacterium]